MKIKLSIDNREKNLTLNDFLQWCESLKEHDDIETIQIDVVTTESYLKSEINNSLIESIDKYDQITELASKTRKDLFKEKE